MFAGMWTSILAKKNRVQGAQIVVFITEDLVSVQGQIVIFNTDDLGGHMQLC